MRIIQVFLPGLDGLKNTGLISSLATKKRRSATTWFDLAQDIKTVLKSENKLRQTSIVPETQTFLKINEIFLP